MSSWLHDNRYVNPTDGSSIPAMLLIEDSEDDEMLVLRVLRKSDWVGAVLVARTGSEARRIMQNWVGAPPRLILMDLNVPELSGLELIELARKLPCTSRAPIVVFTTSPSETQIAASYELGANALVEKPLGFEEMQLAVNRIAGFWLQANLLPTLRPTSQFPVG